MSPTAAPKSAEPGIAKKEYGYPNARLRGMRSRLLRRDRLEQFAEYTDLHQLIQELLQTEYAPDLEEALLQGRGAAEVGEALRLNLVRTYRKVFGFLNGEAADICSIVLGRWDVFNMKTILRGKQAHLPNDEIAAGLLPVGALSQSDLDGLLRQPDIRAVVNTATTWGLPEATALRAGFVEFQRSGDMADFELELDRHFAERAKRELGKRNRNYQMAQRILGMQVDIQNLLMVFRVARANLGAEQAVRYFLPGGADLTLETYQRLSACSDIDEILDGLRGTRFGTVLEEVATNYLETLSIATFERALEDYLMRKVIAMGGTDPLGVGIPLAYLWSKLNEVTNVRIIAKGIAMGVPVERMRRELILV
ncbi:MAG: V-type ATPase subunit [Coriobacteriia bacterium]|nr:V-type ATPase subunit [Coriobacteriia bacterium]